MITSHSHRRLLSKAYPYSSIGSTYICVLETLHELRNRIIIARSLLVVSAMIGIFCEDAHTDIRKGISLTLITSLGLAPLEFCV